MSQLRGVPRITRGTQKGPPMTIRFKEVVSYDPITAQRQASCAATGTHSR